MADRNGNENCLEGRECPICKNHKKLKITCITDFDMRDDGSGDHEDLEYDENSHTQCPECGHNAKLRDFRIKP